FNGRLHACHHDLYRYTVRHTCCSIQVADPAGYDDRIHIRHIFCIPHHHTVAARSAWSREPQLGRAVLQPDHICSSRHRLLDIHHLPIQGRVSKEKHQVCNREFNHAHGRNCHHSSNHTVRNICSTSALRHDHTDPGRKHHHIRAVVLCIHSTAASRAGIRHHFP